MALDDATNAFLQQMAEAGGKPIHESTPEEARATGPLLAQFIGSGPDMEQVDDTTLTSSDGGTFGVRVLRPTANPQAVIVYYHGGGWVVGDLSGFDTLGRQLAQRTNATVVLVDYRLAPEHPYPTPVEDAWAALAWADENREALASADAPLIVAGDSAGGNLSAVMTQRAKSLGGPTIAHQVLVYPVTDANFERPSYVAEENQVMLTREGMVWFFDHYTGSEDVRSHPEVSPLRGEDLAGLPPATVILAEHDPLLDEGAEYAEALSAAGVPTTVETVPGQMHGFFTMVNILPGAATGMDLVVEALESAIQDTAEVAQ